MAMGHRIGGGGNASDKGEPTYSTHGVGNNGRALSLSLRFKEENR